jgi:quercetin dioxygenase-like cupin family protein
MRKVLDLQEAVNCAQEVVEVAEGGGGEWWRSAQSIVAVISQLSEGNVFA